MSGDEWGLFICSVLGGLRDFWVVFLCAIAIGQAARTSGFRGKKHHATFRTQAIIAV